MMSYQESRVVGRFTRISAISSTAARLSGLFLLETKGKLGSFRRFGFGFELGLRWRARAAGGLQPRPFLDFV
jgi:hypothetical protein